MSVSLDIAEDGAQWSALPALALRALDATLGHLGHDPACFEVSFLLCDDTRIRALNRDFRAKDKATNVLSWPTWDLSPETPGAMPEAPETGTPADPEALGDIALSLETCTREAADQGKPLEHHATHLIVHSALHLLGFDHETETDAEIMERIEVEILALLGLPDPYALDETDMPHGVAMID